MLRGIQDIFPKDLLKTSSMLNSLMIFQPFDSDKYDLE